MNRKIILLLLLFTFFTLPISAVSERGFLSVNISENMEIAPDTAEISFAVKTSDTKSMQKASAENKQISDKLYSLLSDMMIPANGDYIKTSNYSASPVYTYVNNKKNFEKYEVSNRVVVHTKSLDKIGVMIDKSLSAGATNVDSLSFSVSGYDKQCDMLLATASKKAYSRAEVIAKNLSSSLDGIKNVDMNCNMNNNSTPRFYLAKNMLSESTADSASGSTTAISGGAIKIYANLNASFYVK